MGIIGYIIGLGEDLVKTHKEIVKLYDRYNIDTERVIEEFKFKLNQIIENCSIEGETQDINNKLKNLLQEKANIKRKYDKKVRIILKHFTKRKKIAFAKVRRERRRKEFIA